MFFSYVEYSPDRNVSNMMKNRGGHIQEREGKRRKFR
jgi:hypothetical protein